MALKKLPYSNLKPLIRRRLSTGEEESASELIRDLRVARVRGHLTKPELERICYWKSPRAIHHIRSNSTAAIRNATRAALTTRSERLRLEALQNLRCLSANGLRNTHTTVSKTVRGHRRTGVAVTLRTWDRDEEATRHRVQLRELVSVPDGHSLLREAARRQSARYRAYPVRSTSAVSKGQTVRVVTHSHSCLTDRCSHREADSKLRNYAARG